MANVTENRLGAAIAAAQRLQLALNHQLDYRTPEDYEHDVDLVVTLLEESRDECWPQLESRARLASRTE